MQGGGKELGKRVAARERSQGIEFVSCGGRGKRWITIIACRQEKRCGCNKQGINTWCIKGTAVAECIERASLIHCESPHISQVFSGLPGKRDIASY